MSCNVRLAEFGNENQLEMSQLTPSHSTASPLVTTRPDPKLKLESRAYGRPLPCVSGLRRGAQNLGRSLIYASVVIPASTLVPIPQNRIIPASSRCLKAQLLDAVPALGRSTSHRSHRRRSVQTCLPVSKAARDPVSSFWREQETCHEYPRL